MDDAEKAATGHVYRFVGGRVETTSIAPVVITNGPAFSPDGRTLYHVDTLGGLIHAIAAGAGGSLGAARPSARIDPADGYPDAIGRASGRERQSEYGKIEVAEEYCK